MSATEAHVHDTSPSATMPVPPEARELRFRIGDMDCPSCVRRIEGHLSGVDGVVAVRASVVARTLRVWHSGTLSPERLRDEVGALGYLAQSLDEGPPAGAEHTWTGRKARLTYAAVALFAAGLALHLLGPASVLVATPFYALGWADVAFLLAAAVGGSAFFSKGVRSALRLSLDMNFLMTVAILGAALIGETLEAAAIAFLFSIAELLESFAVDRARASVAALVELAPDSARVLRDGVELVVPAEVVEPGDLVVVRASERIPVDGRVLSGTSAVDQATITGESIPVDVAPGGDVFAGTMNGEGVLRIEVARRASESTLARIVHLVEEAEAHKARSEQFVERFARVYTPAVTLAAVLVATLPPLLAGAPFADWFLRGLTLLVIACPCALVISTPVAVVSGVTAAARRGVLIKGGAYLEVLGSLRAVAFDKTGTLTVGHPRLMEVRPEPGVDAGELLAAAARVEAGSAHPIARAIVDAAAERAAERPAGVVTDARSLPSLGAAARIDGVEHVVGRPEALEPALGPVAAPADLTDAGYTVVGVAAGARLLGWLAVADEPREGARDVLTALRALGIESVTLLTGDRPETARSIGRLTGVDDVRAALLPADKVAAIKELTARWGGVAMVGDGVNDGPALAASTVGIAMGAAGSDVALETADIALMGDDLSRLPYLVRLSQRASRVIRQNVGAAILVKAVLAVGVPLGMVSLVAAVLIGDMGVSLAVILNALRLGRVAD